MLSHWSNRLKDILRGVKQDKSSVNDTRSVSIVSFSLRDESVADALNFPSPKRFEGFVFFVVFRFFHTSGFVVFLPGLVFSMAISVIKLFVLLVGLNIVMFVCIEIGYCCFNVCLL